VVGTTLRTAVSPAGSTFGAPTDATPGVCARVVAVLSSNVVVSAGEVPGGIWTTTVSGPLMPGPKPAASRS
jgi:hypothetical protein